MKIFITYSEYKPIKPEVLASIKGDIVQINCTFDKKPILLATLPKRQRIILSENRFRETALKEDCDFYVYQQSDIVHVRDDNFPVMQKFLTDNPDFGAVALSRYNLTRAPVSENSPPWKIALFDLHKSLIYYKEINSHICSGCIMFVRKGLEAVKFDLDDGNKATCFSIGKSLADAGLKYGYVDKELRIKHLSGR
jgi:hypothetical protein